MARSAVSDQVRSGVVLVAAIAQIVSAPITMAALGSSSDQGAISDANISPVTPAGYAFAVWGLIYLASITYAVYQLLPTQRTQTVHRRTGWWVAGGFAASTIWVPIFGTRTIWLSQLVILGLVACLAVATWRFTTLGPAKNTAERLLFRLPVTFYLGWATLATAAGFGVTFRSLGMPPAGAFVTGVSLALLLLATAASVLVVNRFSAVVGFALTACWALVAIAVATYVGSVRIAALVAIVVVLGALVRRVRRSRQPTAALLG